MAGTPERFDFGGEAMFNKRIEKFKFRSDVIDAEKDYPSLSRVAPKDILQ
jgi:hypothetical protein